jgi:hypothetical protein
MATTDYDERAERVEVVTERRPRWTAWLAGFVVAIVIAAAAVFAYLAISDDDNDGSVDVPAVDVEVSEPAD